MPNMDDFHAFQSTTGGGSGGGDSGGCFSPKTKVKTVVSNNKNCKQLTISFSQKGLDKNI